MEQSDIVELTGPAPNHVAQPFRRARIRQQTAGANIGDDPRRTAASVAVGRAGAISELLYEPSKLTVARSNNGCGSELQAPSRRPGKLQGFLLSIFFSYV